MCCAYGFHSDWGEKEGFGASKKDADVDNVSEALDKCRYNERYFLSKFLNLVHNHSLAELNMMTAIVKQDLWFKSAKEVEDFYGNEEQTQSDELPGYSKILSNFRAQGNKLYHSFSQLSLLRQEFVANVYGSAETIYVQSEYTATLERGYRELFSQKLEALIRRTAE